MSFNKQKASIFTGAMIVALFFLSIASPKSQAISGAGSYFPDTSPAGQAESFAIVQVTGSVSPSAIYKMKARSTIANIYIPESSVGTSFGFTIVNGCHTPNLYRDSADVNSGYTGFVIKNPTTDKLLAIKISTDAVCTSTNRNISISFTPDALNKLSNLYKLSRVNYNNVNYNVYQFIASGTMTETGSDKRYLNAFGLRVTNPSTLVGISNFPIRCDIANYPMSCPNKRYYSNGVVSGYDSWIYTSLYGPSPASISSNYNQRINVRLTSCAKDGAISFYDLDASDGGLTQSGLAISLTKSGAVVNFTSLDGKANSSLSKTAIQLWEPGISGVLRAHPNTTQTDFGGNNNEYLDLPGGDPMFTSISKFDLNTDYEIKINGIDSDNAFQILPSLAQCEATNTLPTAAITVSCVIAGSATRVDYSITFNDANNDPIYIRSLKVGGVAVTPATSPLLSPYPKIMPGSVNSTYSATGNVSIVIYDWMAIDKTYTSANYRCPPPPAIVSCTINGAELEMTSTGVSHKPTYELKNTSAYSATLNVTLTITGKLSATDSSIPLPANQILPKTSSGTATFSGTADVKDWQITGRVVNSSDSSFVTTCTPEYIKIVQKPFFRISGGDLSVGGGYNNCSPASSDLYSWSDGTKGAYSSHVTKVLNDASGFYSAASFSERALRKKYLTLANTTGDWGGNYNSGTCLSEMYDSTIDSVVAGVAKDKYTSSQLIGATTNFSGKKIIYVSGDAYINGNITLTSSYASLSNIPFFGLIVKGNIYIAPGVTQLDGMYIAEPIEDGTKGVIYTCGKRNVDGTFGPYLDTEIFANCNSLLTVNGLVQANEVKLFRTKGTFADNTPSEIFNGLTELYMIENPLIQNNSSIQKYDSISVLPPLL